MLKATLIILALFRAEAASANVPLPSLPEVQKVGNARLTVMFWDIYDATLYAPKGNFGNNAPFALELKYLMDFSGDDIAERSVEEIRGQGFSDEMKLAAWYSQMRTIFPDVKEGDMLTGVNHPGKGAEFFYNGKSVGSIKDTLFAKQFFHIWLGEQTSQPELRLQLLGMK